MIGAFNPYMAGSSPQQPNISVDTVSKLLGGANAGVQALVDGIQKAGEIDRSSKVNELLASGGFKGLSEEQARQKLAQMTGGQSLNPLVDANVAEVMANQKAREIAQAKAAAELGLEEFKFGNELTKLDKESGYKTELEKLKSNLGLESDLTLEEAKAKNDLVAMNALFGNQSKLEQLKNNLKIENFNKNLDPTRFTVVKDGDKAFAVDKANGTAREISTGLEKSSKDLIKDLPPKAEEFVRGLSPNQRKNWERAYRKGNLAWQDEKTEKVLNKAGLAENKVISSGRFVDLNDPTAAWVTFSNKLNEEEQ